MNLIEGVAIVTAAFFTFLGVVITQRGRSGTDQKPPVSNEQVKQAEHPDVRTLHMLLDQQERITHLETWRAENEPMLASFRGLLIGLAQKLRARIAWRDAGAPPPPPHTDEEMLEEIEALIPTERQVP